MVLALGGVACNALFGDPSQCKTDADCAGFGSGNVCGAGGTCVAQAQGVSPASPADASVTETEAAAPPVVQPEQPDAATDAASDSGKEKDAGSTIKCGDAGCPATAGSVCCVTAAGPTCTTAAACQGAPVACDDTPDCVQLGFGAGYVCCAYNNGAGPALLRSACVLSASCDAAGPQDQMCDLKGPAQQCQVAGDGRTNCAAFTYTNTSDYAFCQTP